MLSDGDDWMVESWTYKYNWAKKATNERITVLDFLKFFIASPANSNNSLFVSEQEIKIIIDNSKK